MLSDALDSFAQVFSPPFRRVMLKSVALTAAALALAAIGLDRLAASFAHWGPGWLQTLTSVVIALGVVAAMILLAAPATSLVAGFFLDEIAVIVEREVDPTGEPGREPGLGLSLMLGARFAALSAAGGVIALALFFVPGVGVASFFVVNGYLLGREYFELAALRHMKLEAARALRRRYSVEVFVAGAVVAALVAVPLLNLVAPLFATSFLTRRYKRIAARDLAPSQSGH